MTITEINITPIKPSNGLIGFASLVINGNFYLSSIGIITKLSGGYRLLYPTKKIGGTNLHYFHPLNTITSKAIETAILTKAKAIFG